MRFNLDSPYQRAIAWLYAMLVEHNFTNVVRLNFHQISHEAFRSSQPTMWQLRRIVKKYGIKTILNLKGANHNSAYWLFEREQCAQIGVRLIDIDIYSRSIPRIAQIRRAQEIFASVEYPIWMHCKAGADRTGIYATFYQYFRQQIPLNQTNQLRFWPFGHSKYSNAGKIDYYLAQFWEYQKHHPEIDFLFWAENIADPKQLERSFQAGGVTSFIYDYILRRE